MSKGKSNSRAKKTSPKTEANKASDKKKTAAENKNDLPTNEENPFDFGGLPQRDLKKNLGCG